MPQSGRDLSRHESRQRGLRRFLARKPPRFCSQQPDVSANVTHKSVLKVYRSWFCCERRYETPTHLICRVERVAPPQERVVEHVDLDVPRVTQEIADEAGGQRAG